MSHDLARASEDARPPSPTAAARDTRLAFLLSAQLITLVYRLVHLEFGYLVLSLGGLFVDACVFAAGYLFVRTLDHAPSTLRRAADALYYAWSAFLFALSVSFTFFFETALERRFSLLDVKADGVSYFFENVMPAEGLLHLGALCVVLALGTWLLRRVLPVLATRQVGIAWAVGTALLAVALAFKAPAASPWIDTYQDALEIWRMPSVYPARDARYPLTMLSRQRDLPRDFAPLFDKVIVFVLESQTANKLERERRKLPKDTFLNAAEAHLHRYDRYFPGNQDSRTGMLGMLVPEVNPQEAYTDADVARYAQLVKRPNLVSRMRALGYETAFAISQVETELVVRDLPWQHILHLDDASRAQADKRFVCLNPYEFEHSCEDLALLPRVLDFLDDHARAFLYLEFAWGHAFAYNEALKKTDARYYSHYIDQVISHLSARGELDRTLIALVSDHGLRERKLLEDLEAYRIPLWFWATRFEPTQDQTLHSHLDFADLLFAHMGDTSQLAPPNPFVLMTGPTNSSLWAAITLQGDFMLLKSRGERQLLLRHENRAGATLDPNAPAALARLREDARRRLVPR